MRALHTTSFILLLVVLANAQQDSVPATRTFTRFSQTELRKDSLVLHQDTTLAAPGQVEYLIDPRIERTMLDHVDRSHPQDGYRVQIFLGDRKTAEDTKRTFLQQHPDATAYLSWLAPNFRLRVGDLRTRLEAEHMLRDLKVQYPGSYIVRDVIEPPKLPVTPTP
jgi:hypothetical protein